MQLFLSAEPNTPRIAGVLESSVAPAFLIFSDEIPRGSERNDRSTKRGQGTNHVWHIHIENEEKKKGRVSRTVPSNTWSQSIVIPKLPLNREWKSALNRVEPTARQEHEAWTDTSIWAGTRLVAVLGGE